MTDLLPYRIAGVPTFHPKDIDHLEKLLTQLIHKKYGIIFIIENYLAEAEKIFEEYSDEIVPALIPIPGAGQSESLGQKRQNAMMEQAVGMNIMQEDEA